MLVIFAAFIVFKEGRVQRAKFIEESVHVWPVKGGNNIYADYHGYFDAEKFEQKESWAANLFFFWKLPNDC
jgi:hypothetical protein